MSCIRAVVSGEAAFLVPDTAGAITCLRTAVEPQAVTPVSVKGETGHAVPPEDFLDLLAVAFARWQAQFETFGFAPIRNAWLARAARLGEPIIARTGGSEHHGIFEGVDDSGALVLKTAAGRQVIPAADVYFGG